MTSPISAARWRHAQGCQLRYQERKSAGMRGHEDALVAHARDASRRAHALLEAQGQLRRGVVVEVGAGAHGLIWQWPAGGTRVGVDPLAGFYRGAFAGLQEPSGVSSLCARGEELPLRDEVADLVLSDNVVDHAADPARFLRECRRIMKPDGRLYFTVDVHHAVWRWSSATYNRLYDAGLSLSVPAFPDHPFHFTEADVRRLFDDAGLAISWSRCEAPARPKLHRSRPYDILKHVFFKNARLELIARRR